MNLEDADEKILTGYLHDFINGAKTTIKSVTETPKGEIIRRSMKRTTSPKDRLEYLRMRQPEQWKIPQPQPIVSISQNTISVGMEDLKQLLIPKAK